MGEPDVIEIGSSWFLGIGISFAKYNALEITIVIPFIQISFYFKKTSQNKWFSTHFFKF